MTPYMWRQIIGQSIYQILVMTFLMYFGGLIFFPESFNLVHGPLPLQKDENENDPEVKLRIDSTPKWESNRK